MLIVLPSVIVVEATFDVFERVAGLTVTVNVFVAVLLFLSVTTTLILYLTAEPGLTVTEVAVVFEAFVVQSRSAFVYGVSGLI